MIHSSSDVRPTPSLAAEGRGAFLLVLLLLIVAVLGCEEEVTDPILGTDRTYSLYGTLAPERDTQWVRIYPIVELLEPTSSDPLGVQLRSTDVTAGTTRTWRDSVIREPDGRYAHVFWSPFEPRYEHTYRLEAVGAGGQRASASVTVPATSRLEVMEPDTVRDRPISTPRNWAEIPIRIHGEVPRLINLRVDYCMEYPTEENILTSGIFTLNYNGRQEKVPGGWLIRIPLHEDHQTLVPVLRQTREYPRLRIHGIRIRLHVVDEGWNPPHEDNEFNPNVIVEPGVMSNVEGGFGFVGSGYRHRDVLHVEDAVYEKAGFRPVSSCPVPYQ